MFKFVILCALITLVRAQYDPFEVCQGYEDGEMIGVGQDISCTQYFYCEGGYGYEEDCRDTFEEYSEFNYETGQCDYDDVVNCASYGPLDPEPETEPPFTDPPVVNPPVTQPGGPAIPDVECPTNRPGEIIFFPSSNCSEYFICANGARLQMACMEGFAWNQEERTCDYPIFSRCSSNIEDDGLTVRCTRNGFYTTAYPRDCTKFVFCSAGIPMVQNCPVGYAWNIDRCVERQYASCPDLRRLG